MPNGTDKQAGTTGETPFRSLPTTTMFRTSEPTNELVRSAIANVYLKRKGRRPSADAVIYAAMKIVERHPSAVDVLAEAVAEIEGRTFPAGGGS
jgi:hypothetical protein